MSVAVHVSVTTKSLVVRFVRWSLTEDVRYSSHGGYRKSLGVNFISCSRAADCFQYILVQWQAGCYLQPNGHVPYKSLSRGHQALSACVTFLYTCIQGIIDNSDVLSCTRHNRMLNASSAVSPQWVFAFSRVHKQLLKSRRLRYETMIDDNSAAKWSATQHAAHTLHFADVTDMKLNTLSTRERPAITRCCFPAVHLQHLWGHTRQPRACVWTFLVYLPHLPKGCTPLFLVRFSISLPVVTVQITDDPRSGQFLERAGENQCCGKCYSTSVNNHSNIIPCIQQGWILPMQISTQRIGSSLDRGSAWSLPDAGNDGSQMYATGSPGFAFPL